MSDISHNLNDMQIQIYNAILEGRNVFFTGSAGTGKSFLLKYIIERFVDSDLYITSSTGITALQLGGTTLHSFAGVGLGTDSFPDLLYAVKKNGRAMKRLLSCKKLLIDEISMIDNILFDKLELLARTLRCNNKPFGGIQLIVAGDFLQLPPVKGLLDSSEKGFIFLSPIWESIFKPENCFLLQTVIRQSDSIFSEALNNIRIGIVSNDYFQIFNKCVNRNFSDSIIPTKLYSTRLEVDVENYTELLKLPEESIHKYNAFDSGIQYYINILQNNCIARDDLELRIGAQVMLIKNINSELVNGSRGVVIDFVEIVEDNGIQITIIDPNFIKLNKCETVNMQYPVVKFTNGTVITMTPEVWEIKVGKKILAYRIQIPLILAWALTIHKCQGMTLDRVILDLNNIFEYGQMYVSLSRVRNLEGLCILDSFPVHKIKAHPQALCYYKLLELYKK
jgi:ATP-dependent DNA helicase PIF1